MRPAHASGTARPLAAPGTTTLTACPSLWNARRPFAGRGVGPALGAVARSGGGVAGLRLARSRADPARTTLSRAKSVLGLTHFCHEEVLLSPGTLAVWPGTRDVQNGYSFV